MFSWDATDLETRTKSVHEWHADKDITHIRIYKNGPHPYNDGFQRSDINELFRFVAVQGPPLNTKEGLIDGGEIIAGSQLAKDVDTKDAADRADVAAKYMAGGRFVKGSDAGLRVLLHLAAAFKSRHRITQKGLEVATQEALGVSVAVFAKDAKSLEFKQRLAESLLACRLVSRLAPVGLRGKLALALRVIHVVEAVAGKTPQMRNILARPWAQMVVFDSIKRNAKKGAGSSEEKEPGRSPGEGDSDVPKHPTVDNYAEIAAAIRRIDGAILELRDASAQFSARLAREDLAAENDLDVSEARERPSALRSIAGVFERLFQSPRAAPTRPSPQSSIAHLLEPHISEGTQQLLRGLGLSMHNAQDFADVEEKLSNLRAASRSRMRRTERRSRSMLKNVPGGAIPSPFAGPALYDNPDIGPLPDSSVFIPLDPRLRDPGGPGAPITVGTAKVLDGLLMRVEDKIVGYEAGAIGKIVNIPATATKSIETRLLTRTEETTETETGETSATEQSVETQERFALKNETENEINLEMSAKVAGAFSATYGAVSAEGSAEAATTFGMHSATSTASDYAKNVVEKAVSRLVKTKREFGRRTRVVELRDRQKEGFDNTGGANVTAIYQWVDEVHESRLLNYGSRMMLEFLVPQPGAVLLWSVTSEAAQKDVPQPPPPFDISLADLEPGGIADLVEEYGATDIPSAPPRYRFISKTLKIAETLSSTGSARAQYMVADETVTVPEGYQVEVIWARLLATLFGNSGANYELAVGNKLYSLEAARWIWRWSRGTIEAIVPLTGVVPIAITGAETRAATAIVILRCERTPELLDQWRTDVYAALKKAHQRKVEEYEDRLRMARVRGGASVQARNPAQNRTIERDEIKRSAISILTAQHYEAFSAISVLGPLGIPRIRFDEATSEGEYIQFFESAFEWTQIEYILHPYFWANPTADWINSLRLQMDDTLHEEFLRAGAARVVVPVRPGFEAALLTYLSHPESPVLWDGQEYKDIDMDSEMYFPIWRAIMEQQGQTETAPEQVGDPWYFRIPTNHQIISNSGVLPAPPPAAVAPSPASP